MSAWSRILIACLSALAVVLYFIGGPPPEEPVRSDDAPRAGTARVEAAGPEPVGTSLWEPKPGPAPVPTAPRFEKLDGAGRIVPANARIWNCVRDNENGLVWEVKQDNGGLRDLEFTYSWYASDGDVGVPDGGNCFYIFCDTQSLVRAVNEKGLCGWRDWRLPTNVELMTLDTERLYYDPDIDQRYFPNTRSGYYWTSTPATVGPLTWSVNFLNGFPEVSPRRLAYHVRLVRGD